MGWLDGLAITIKDAASKVEATAAAVGAATAPGFSLDKDEAQAMLTDVTGILSDLEEQVNRSVELGARVLTGGKRLAGILKRCVDEAHAEVFGAKPERDTVRWFSDASTLTRYGIESVNYGTSSGLPDPVLGENLDVDGLVKIAQVYALVAQRVCEVA